MKQVKMSEVFVTEYSRTQDQFHVESLEKACNYNRLMMQEGKENDFVPVHCADSYAECAFEADRIRDKMTEEQDV